MGLFQRQDSICNLCEVSLIFYIAFRKKFCAQLFLDKVEIEKKYLSVKRHST